MADQATRTQEAMYCHACHHQWQKAGESIECPACMSASTEIVGPDNDPRHFHNPHHEATATTDAAAVPSAPSPNAAQASSQGAAGPTAAAHPPSAGETPVPGGGPNGGSAEGSTPNAGSGHLPRFTFRFTTADVPPTVTFFTFVTGNAPPPAPENPPPRSAVNPPPVTFFGMQFFPHFHPIPPHAPPPTVNNSPPAEADPTITSPQPAQQHSNTTPGSDGQQQPHPTITSPRPAVIHMDMLMPLLTSLFNPSNAIIGDAVYSQEALDRIITHLREQQTQSGGAPPASQAALARALQTRELDDKMLARHGCEDGSARCVVCVDDMVKGESVAVLPCEHFFHGACVRPWLELHNTCPVCRRSVEVEGEEGKAGKGVGVGDAVASAERSAAAPVGGGEGAGAMDCS